MDRKVCVWSVALVMGSLMVAGGGSLAVAADAAAPAPATSAAPAVSAAAPAASEDSGLAAVYSDRLNGHRTASGKIYHRNGLTAAHKTLAFGTRVKVTNVKNNKSVVVTITDRGPKQAGRVLDLTPRAAHKIGIGSHGMAEVKLEVVEGGKK